MWPTRSPTVQCSLYFLSLYPPLPSPGTPVLTTSIETRAIYFIVLMSHSLWISCVCCRNCNRRLLYEITMQLPVCSLSSLFVYLGLCLRLALKSALKNTKTYVCFVFLCLARMLFFFRVHRILRNTFPPPLPTGYCKQVTVHQWIWAFFSKCLSCFRNIHRKDSFPVVRCRKRRRRGSQLS